MQDLTVFQNSEFGQLEILKIKNKYYFPAADCATKLGYKDTINAIKQHCRWVAKHHVPHPQSPNKAIEKNFIPEGDLYRLITHSKLPSAEKFETWVFDEVLPQIRKTGSYNSPDKQKRLEVYEKNVRNRAAQIYLNLAKTALTESYKNIMLSYAAKELSGEYIIPLPVQEQKTYSASDIAARFGVTANLIGRLANLHNLKTDEYGRLYADKSPHSRKEVETFRYYDSVIPKFEELFSTGGVAQ